MAIQTRVKILKKEPSGKYNQLSAGCEPIDQDNNMNAEIIWVNAKPDQARANVIIGLQKGQIVDLEQKSFTTQEGVIKEYWEIEKVYPMESSQNGNSQTQRGYTDPQPEKKPLTDKQKEKIFIAYAKIYRMAMTAVRGEFVKPAKEGEKEDQYYQGAFPDNFIPGPEDERSAASCLFAEFVKNHL